MIILSYNYLKNCKQRKRLSLNSPYLPKDRSSKRNLIVINPFSTSFINQGVLTLITEVETEVHSMLSQTLSLSYLLSILLRINSSFLKIISFLLRGFPGGSAVKDLPANAGDLRDTGSTPVSGRSPGGGNGCPFKYACLGNPTGRAPGGAWWAIVRGLQRFRHDWATEQAHMALSWEAHTRSPFRIKRVFNPEFYAALWRSSFFPGYLSHIHEVYFCFSLSNLSFITGVSAKNSEDKKKMIFSPLQHGHPSKYTAITKGEKALSF